MYSLIKIQSKNDHDDDSSHAEDFKIVCLFFPFKTDNTQFVSYSAASNWSVHVKRRRVIGQFPVPLQKESVVAWMGFRGLVRFGDEAELM